MENLNKIKNKVEEMKAKYSLEQEQEDNPNHSDGFGMYWSGFFTCLKEISFFLDSLQQGQQEVDLEKAFSDWWKTTKNANYEADILYEQYSRTSKELARHFYELGLKSK